ncbi:MAG: GNAT family N-acetyltransferase [Chlamydiales bacterium]|nr:GNAT family N-acetyltransferase [Chlamydiales bacterium]
MKRALLLSLTLIGFSMNTQASDQKRLEEHCQSVYRTFSEGSGVADAVFEKADGIPRCSTGILHPFMNAVFGAPPDADASAYIDREQQFFKERKMPFVWYVNEESSQAFRDQLISRGFKDLGVLRGVIGTLDKPIAQPDVPADCTLELVTTEAEMDEFNALVCTTFEYHGESRDLYRKTLWKAAVGTTPKMYHWVARKQGRVVSALTTFIEGDMVSFWNGASAPELRKQGLSTALRYLALRHAISKGCCIGASFLMSEGMALGICTKLGYEPKWYFSAFLAPSNQE